MEGVINSSMEQPEIKKSTGTAADIETVDMDNEDFKKWLFAPSGSGKSTEMEGFKDLDEEPSIKQVYSEANEKYGEEWWKHGHSKDVQDMLKPVVDKLRKEGEYATAEISFLRKGDFVYLPKVDILTERQAKRRDSGGVKQGMNNFTENQKMIKDWREKSKGIGALLVDSMNKNKILGKEVDKVIKQDKGKEKEEENENIIHHTVEKESKLPEFVLFSKDLPMTDKYNDLRAKDIKTAMTDRFNVIDIDQVEEAIKIYGQQIKGFLEGSPNDYVQAIQGKSPNFAADIRNNKNRMHDYAFKSGLVNMVKYDKNDFNGFDRAELFFRNLDMDVLKNKKGSTSQGSSS